MILLPLLLLLGCSAPSTVTITPAPGPNAKVIIVVNQSSKIPDAAVFEWAQTINIQVERDFGMWRGSQHYSIEFFGHVSQPMIFEMQNVFVWGTAVITDQGPWNPNQSVYGWHDKFHAITVTANIPNAPVSVILSHEILEAIAGYQGPDGSEPCDDLGNASYAINDIQVADFKLPAWYHPGQSGPFDFMNQVKSAGQSLLR